MLLVRHRLHGEMRVRGIVVRTDFGESRVFARRRRVEVGPAVVTVDLPARGRHARLVLVLDAGPHWGLGSFVGGMTSPPCRGMPVWYAGFFVASRWVTEVVGGVALNMAEAGEKTSVR